MKEAVLWHKEGDKIRCDLCGRRCLIANNALGTCLVRKNIEGKLYSLNYGKLIALHVDPIEKKPLFHFHPGSFTFSIASAGCNFACKFCFEPTTRVLTNKGMLSFEELFNKGRIVNEGDGFISLPEGYSALTHEGKFSRISKVYKHPYSGEMIVIKPYYLPKLKVTPSHRFFVYDKNKGEIKKIRADEIRREHLLVLPKLNENVSEENRIIDVKEIISKHYVEHKKGMKIDRGKAMEISRSHSMGKTSREIGETFDMHPSYIRRLMGKLRREVISDELFYIKDMIVERGGLVRLKEERSFIKRFISLDEDFARLLGYYCAKGFVTWAAGQPNSRKLVFSFGKHERKMIKDAKRLIKKLFNKKPKVVKRRTTTAVEISSTSLAILFEALAGKGCLNKVIPKAIIECGNDKIAHAFLKAYFESDGYKRRGGEWVTVSADVAHYLFLFLLKLGIMPSFYELTHTEKGIIENRINQHPYFRIKIHGPSLVNFLNGRDTRTNGPGKLRLIENGNHYFVRIRSIEKEAYSGFVFNLEVEDQSHSYLSNFVSVANCCNYDISQVYRDRRRDHVVGEEYSPEDVVNQALSEGCNIISYTYTEPTIFFEFAYDTAKLAHEKGVKNTFVTNGYMTPEAVRMFMPYLDAVTVDFKCSGDPGCYRKIMSVPDVKPIYDCLIEMRRQRIFVEITNLVIPGFDDDMSGFRNLVKWIKDNLGDETPLHILRFFPTYGFSEIPDTPLESLRKAYEIAKQEGIKFVYLGNVPGQGENTYCPNCKELLIERFGLMMSRSRLSGDKCPKCGTRIPVVI